MEQEHICHQEKVIDLIVARLSNGQGDFAAIRKSLSDIQTELGNIKGQIGILQGKSAALGAIAGAVAGVAVALMLKGLGLR